MIVAAEHLNFIKCTFLMLFLVVGEFAHAMVVRIDHVDRRGEMWCWIFLTARLSLLGLFASGGEGRCKYGKHGLFS